MKKHVLIIAVLSLCFSFSEAQLTYQQITSGLNSVSFEGGDSEFEAGDIDGDGDLDLVSIGDHGSPNVNVTEAGIMVWKNNGTGTSWSLTKNGNLGYGGVALGDVNNDGKMDVAMGMHHNYATSGMGSQMMEVALGNGSGSSWTQSSSGLLGNGNWGMFAPDFGDVNNDGLLDIVCTPFSYDDGFRVYKNSNNGSSWTSSQTMSTGNIINYNCKLGDFNNDGNIDAMIACQAGSVYKGNGQGTFSSMKTGLPADWTMKFAIGDMDNNGSKDVAIVSSGAITTYKYNGSAWVTFGNTSLPTTNAKNVGLADMDMDGFCDLLAFEATGITIYKGDGAGNWTANGAIALTISYVRGLALADFDHDGFSDIAYFGSSGGNNSLKVFLHTVSSPTLNILPDFPKGLECFKPNSVQFVKWQSSVPSGPNATVTIDFSSAGASGPWTTIASNVSNNGTYQWVLPNISSNNCYLKYTITQSSNSQSVIISNAFGIGNCTPPPPTGIEESTTDLEFEIYPNPASTTVSVIVNGAKQSFNIYSAIGEKVGGQQLTVGINTIDISGLKSGIYFFEMKIEKSARTQKLVIVK